jgi:pilus assembly protein CpaB
MKISRISYIVAIVLALIAGVAVYAYQSSADQRALQGKAAVQVYVSQQDIPVGVKLSDIYLQGLAKKENFPADSVPVGAISDITTANGDLVVSHPITKGELLLDSQVGTQAAAASQIVVPDGQVAVSVNVDDSQRVANFLVPGAQVVVYYTAADRTSVRVLLPRADIIAVGSTSTSSTTGSGTVVSPSVTLALPPADAARVVLATHNGTVYFGLLSKTTAVAPGSGVALNNLFGN